MISFKLFKFKVLNQKKRSIMLSLCEISDIFYLCDVFSIEFNKKLPDYHLKEDNGKKHRNKPNQLSVFDGIAANL